MFRNFQVHNICHNTFNKNLVTCNYFEVMFQILRRKSNIPVPLSDETDQKIPRDKSMFLNERVPYKDLYKNFGLHFALFLTLVLITSGIFIAFERKAHEKNEDVESNIIGVVHDFGLTHNVSEEEIHLFMFKIQALDEDWHQRMTYQEAFVMTLSIFFTIGWGHVLPVTSGGKYFAVLISVIGIPLSFILLVSGGHIISRHVYDIIKAVKIFLQSRSSFYNPDSSQTRVSKYLFIPTLIGLIVIFIIVTSYFISKLDGFTYSDSIYYSCITFFTIGFGDFHQSAMFEQDHIGKSTGLTVFMFFWLVIGLSMFASLLIVICTFNDDQVNIGNLQSLKRSESPENNTLDTDEDMF